MDDAIGAVLSWFVPIMPGGMFIGACISMTHGLVGHYLSGFDWSVAYLTCFGSASVYH
jgi:hypothetical protein